MIVEISNGQVYAENSVKAISEISVNTEYRYSHIYTLSFVVYGVGFVVTVPANFFTISTEETINHSRKRKGLPELTSTEWKKYSQDEYDKGYNEAEKLRREYISKLLGYGGSKVLESIADKLDEQTQSD